MKHIKKKFLVGHKLKDETRKFLESVEVSDISDAQLELQDFEGTYAFMLTSTNDLIQAFPYENNGHKYFIPEPNPIVIYFNNAQAFLRGIVKTREALFLKLDSQPQFASQIMNASYDYFAHVTTHIIFLFNTIEAFINLQIKEDTIFEIKKDDKTERYNRDQIERHLSFERKIKEVIPFVTGRTFHTEFGHKYQSILALKILRDEIVHTKVHFSNKPNLCQALFTNLLNYKFENYMNHVRDYVNYYSPELIQPCDCGKDQ